MGFNETYEIETDREHKKLTKRNQEVLFYLLHGLQFRDIAKLLFITHSCVMYHVTLILKHYSAGNVYELFLKEVHPELYKKLRG